MKTFALVYGDDQYGCAQRMVFEADDAYAALKLAQGQFAGRSAELWLEDKMLCTLTRVGREGMVWEVGPARERRIKKTASHKPPTQEMAIRPTVA